jgi:hypothetical protein
MKSVKQSTHERTTPGKHTGWLVLYIQRITRVYSPYIFRRYGDVLKPRNIIFSIFYKTVLKLHCMKDLRFSQWWLWRMLPSGMWCHVGLVWTDVLEEHIASIFRVEKSAAATCSYWFLAQGFFYPDDGCNTFLRNIRLHKTYMAPHPRRRHSSLYEVAALLLCLELFKQETQQLVQYLCIVERLSLGLSLVLQENLPHILSKCNK